MGKNIHLIPTDKPSRLLKDDFGKYFISLNIDQEQKHFNPQYIYITNSEKIKDGDWFYVPNQMMGHEHISNEWFDDLPSICAKKIILTTDPDLIKDGIQAIDDEFLEWFVRNPCEEVEVKKSYSDFMPRLVLMKRFRIKKACQHKRLKHALQSSSMAD